MKTRTQFSLRLRPINRTLQATAQAPNPGTRVALDSAPPPPTAAVFPHLRLWASYRDTPLQPGRLLSYQDLTLPARVLATGSSPSPHPAHWAKVTYTRSATAP